MRLLVTGLNPTVKGGTENVVFNYIQYFQTQELQIDILFYKECSYMDDITFLPVSCHVVDFDHLESFFVGKNYDYIWHHSSVNKVFKELELAKQYGVPHRILHSHMSRPEERGILKTLKSVFKKWQSSLFVTDYWTCSEVSKTLFLPSNRPKAKLLPNAIPVDVYGYNEQDRSRLRSRFSDSDIVIGHIARLSEQKNQGFLITLFERIYAQLPQAKLVIVGAGPDEHALRCLVHQKNLTEAVYFMGWEPNPSRYYNAFDLFLLPSLHEGLPLSVLEAQANGLPVLMSKEATDPHLNLTGLVNEVSLTANLEEWVNSVMTILEKPYDRCNHHGISQSFAKHHFNIADNAVRLENYFLTRSDNPFI